MSNFTTPETLETEFSEAAAAAIAVPEGQMDRSLRALLIEPTNDTFAQFVRYLITGVIALAADFGTLFALSSYAHIHYLKSAIVAFLVGVTINYLMSSSWVFGHRVIANRALEFGIFAVIGVVGLGLNELGLWLLSSVFGIYYLVSKLITTGVVFVWNFGARKLALFR